MPDHRLRLVSSRQTPTLSSKNCSTRPALPANNTNDWPASLPASVSNALANKIQWLALNHPAMLRTFETVIDKLQADAAANSHEGRQG